MMKSLNRVAVALFAAVATIAGIAEEADGYCTQEQSDELYRACYHFLANPELLTDRNCECCQVMNSVPFRECIHHYNYKSPNWDILEYKCNPQNHDDIYGHYRGHYGSHGYGGRYGGHGSGSGNDVEGGRHGGHDSGNIAGGSGHHGSGGGGNGGGGRHGGHGSGNDGGGGSGRHGAGGGNEIHEIPDSKNDGDRHGSGGGNVDDGGNEGGNDGGGGGDHQGSSSGAGDCKGKSSFKNKLCKGWKKTFKKKTGG